MLNDDDFKIESVKNIRSDKEIEAFLDQFLALQKTDPHFDERLAIEFLEEIKEFSPDIDTNKLKTFFDGLWKRTTTKKGSEKLMKILVDLNFDYIRQKLENIVLEGDRDGWNLIKYIDGYAEIFEICLQDSSGTFFQAMLKYFTEKVRMKEFIDKISQQIAKTLIDDVRYRISIREFCGLFPEKLRFCTSIIEETNGSLNEINEMMLKELLKSDKEDFLMLTIGFSEFSYLIDKVY